METVNGRALVVLGYDVAEALFPDESAIGKTVRIIGKSFGTNLDRMVMVGTGGGLQAIATLRFEWKRWVFTMDLSSSRTKDPPPYGQ